MLANMKPSARYVAILFGQYYKQVMLAATPGVARTAWGRPASRVYNDAGKRRDRRGLKDASAISVHDPDSNDIVTTIAEAARWAAGQKKPNTNHDRYPLLHRNAPRLLALVAFVFWVAVIHSRHQDSVFTCRQHYHRSSPEP